MRLLLRFVDARRMPVIARSLIVAVVLGHAGRSMLCSLLCSPLRSMLRVPLLRRMRLMRIRGPLAMRRRTMLVAARRHRVNGRMPAMTRHFDAQVFASAENFGAPVAARVKMPMTLTVRTRHPEIRVAADEHHVAIHHTRDIHVARCGDKDGLWRGRRRAYDDGGRWRRLHRDDGGTRPGGRGSNLLLAGDATG